MWQGERQGERQYDWRIGAVWWLGWAVASSVWCVSASTHLSATFDEPLYLAEGLKCWRTGTHAGLLRWGTMPLPADTQTLPLFVTEQLTGQSWDLDRDFPEALRVMRIGNLPFWWLLLLYAGILGRSLAGVWGGRLAVVLCACEPNLLAHATLATTDIAITGLLLAFVHHWRAGRDGSWWLRIGLPGLLYGVALLAKASALAFVPVLMLALEVQRWFSGQVTVRRFVLDAVQVGILGFVVLFALCGNDWRSDAGFVTWANKLPEGDFRDKMVWLADSLRIFPNAGEGIVRQIKHNMRGHGMFLLGQSHDAAVWYYFPVLVTVKEPLALMLAGLCVLVVRPKSLLNAATIGAFALFLFSLNCRVQIGLRLILPCIALGIVGVAAGLASAATESGFSAVRRGVGRFSTALVGWLLVVSATTWPDGLRYVNEIWGGSANGYRIVSDSNYDWGQGLPELACWAREHDTDNLDVWYFGTDPGVKRPPFRHVQLHLLPIKCPGDVQTHVQGRYLAAGTTVVYGHALTNEHRVTQSYLRTLTPVARTGTFLIYELHAEPTP